MDLSGFLSAGFLVTRSIPRPPWMSAELLPDRILTASACIAPPCLPDVWAISWANMPSEERAEAAARFGLEEIVDQVLDWVTDRVDGEIGWPNVIFSLDTAAALLARFPEARDGSVVLELGLHESDLEVFGAAAEPPPLTPGGAPWGKPGVLEAVMNGDRVGTGGEVLGFELLCLDLISFSLGCSWLCNRLETEVHRAMGIRPNRHGLIDDYDAARRSIDFIRRPDTGAEPGLWLPWLLVDHTTEAARGSSS